MTTKKTTLDVVYKAGWNPTKDGIVCFIERYSLGALDEYLVVHSRTGYIPEVSVQWSESPEERATNARTACATELPDVHWSDVALKAVEDGIDANVPDNNTNELRLVRVLLKEMEATDAGGKFTYISSVKDVTTDIFKTWNEWLLHVLLHSDTEPASYYIYVPKEYFPEIGLSNG